MRLFVTAIGTLLLTLQVSNAQSNQDFSGAWNLNPARSEIQSSVPSDPALKVEQSAASVTWSGSATTPAIYPLDGRAEKRRVGGSDFSTTTKWEGAALLVNTIVSGPQNYTVMERWTRSRDGNTLTIRRTVVRLRNETESTLVYSRAGSAALSTSNSAAPAPDAPAARALLPIPATPIPPAPAEFVVDQGTRILLRLTNSVNTKRTAPGDRVYLETAVPVFVDGRLLIPRGSYVTGTVTESKEAGRVKGKAALNLRFDSLTLPNGVTRDFRSRAASADARGNLDRSEGRIEGEGNKSGDAKTVSQTTAAGAGIGTIAGAATGHYGLGAGIGAAAGAAAGLAGVLSSRGPEVVLPPGTTMELVLDRDLRFTSEDLRPAPR
jgi:hypothetical protein